MINMKDNCAVLLISHGSSLPYAEDTFKKIAEKFKTISGLPTEVGYMKVSEPTIAQAIKNLKDSSNEINKIIALPVFLAPGIHTNIDIPIILGLDPLEVDPRCPDGNYGEDHYLYGLEEIDFDGEIKLLRPIGADDDLLKLINKRINEALNDSTLSQDAKTAILLVSHGSRLKYNKEFISEVYDKFSKVSAYPSEFGFMELETPNIPTSINKLTSSNDIERLIVVPVFIAPGVHTTNDIPVILGLKEDTGHSHGHDHGDHHHHHDLSKIDFDGEILYPEPIGADDILIEILNKKIKDSL
ncbi:sirohydrochlorin nickelochelatase [Methanobrevibacter sp. DSM 116169]|uniref:sirohydrochlorin nickelochelatase n=1 Tax=Methanobrevibacter sp. DSM 116169 TaxID=3242727 RepID=UPI0038FCA48D